MHSTTELHPSPGVILQPKLLKQIVKKRLAGLIKRFALSSKLLAQNEFSKSLARVLGWQFWYPIAPSHTWVRCEESCRWSSGDGWIKAPWQLSGEVALDGVGCGTNPVYMSVYVCATQTCDPGCLRFP